MIPLIFKALFGAYFLFLVSHKLHDLRRKEQDDFNTWKDIFSKMYQLQKRHFKKNEFFKDHYNQSRYNVQESPVYCFESDAYKVLHPDVLLQDYHVWRDYTKSNLQKLITLERSYAVLPNVKTLQSKSIQNYTIPSLEASLKYIEQFPPELTYLYISVSSIYNNYRWGRGLGCNFQKYNHLPGKSSVAQKNFLINNFMDSMKKLEDHNVTNPECKRNASFIPDTYRLNSKKDCLNFFEYLNSEEYKRKFEKYGPQYIMKTNAHRGEGITVLFEKEEAEFRQTYNNGTKCGEVSQQIIAQRYVSNPFLYKGHKIEFRIYFTIVSTQPVIAYSYQRALIKRCAKPFDVHSTDKAAHVCNTAIVKKVKGTDDDAEIEDEEFFIDWYLEGLQDLLLQQKRIKDKNWLKNYLYPRVYRSLIHMVRATYHTFSRDSRFSEFFAVDFLLDDDLEVWVLEVNYNPQVLSVTPERIKRNYKMVEDTFEVQFAYVRSKYLRLVKFLKQTVFKIAQKEKLNDYLAPWSDQIMNLVQDKLEKGYQISKDNLYVKIMDEGLPGTEAYNNLIQEECLV